MKKIITICLLFVLALGLVGCDTGYSVETFGTIKTKTPIGKLEYSEEPKLYYFESNEDLISETNEFLQYDDGWFDNNSLLIVTLMDSNENTYSMNDIMNGNIGINREINSHNKDTYVILTLKIKGRMKDVESHVVNFLDIDNVQDETYKLTLENEDGYLVYPLQKSYKAGEKVEVVTGIIMDADLVIYLNDEPIEMIHSDVPYWKYEFIMPNKDSVLRFNVEGGLPYYYGIYNEYGFYYIPGENNVETTETIDRVKFNYNDSGKIYGCKNDEQLTLQECFDRGIITHDNLVEINELHKNDFPFMYEDENTYTLNEVLGFDKSEITKIQYTGLGDDRSMHEANLEETIEKLDVEYVRTQSPEPTIEPALAGTPSNLLCYFVIYKNEEKINCLWSSDKTVLISKSEEEWYKTKEPVELLEEHKQTPCQDCGKCISEDCTGSEEEKCTGCIRVNVSEKTYVSHLNVEEVFSGPKCYIINTYEEYIKFINENCLMEIQFGEYYGAVNLNYYNDVYYPAYDDYDEEYFEQNSLILVCLNDIYKRQNPEIVYDVKYENKVIKVSATLCVDTYKTDFKGILFYFVETSKFLISDYQEIEYIYDKFIILD